MPRGGSRPGSGRPKGKQNEETRKHKARLQDLAREHTEQALKTLVDVMKFGQTETARLSAANSILDRGYGKPAQAVQVSGDEEAPLVTAVQHVVIDPPVRDE